ncbi:hypothetical protein RI367_007409 [Sorochytrium milnesiophthora]
MAQKSLRQYMAVAKVPPPRLLQAKTKAATTERPQKRVKVFHGLPTSDDGPDDSSLPGQRDGRQMEDNPFAETQELLARIAARKAEQASGAVAIRVLEQEQRLSPSKARPVLLSLPASPKSPSILSSLQPAGAHERPSPARTAHLLAEVAAVPNQIEVADRQEDDDDSDDAAGSRELPHLRALQRSPAKLKVARTVPDHAHMSPARHLVLPLQKVKLPESYEALDQIFNALEYNLLYMTTRDQTAIYHKMRKSVENVCERTFELRNLRQIKFLFPEAYVYHAVKVVVQGTKIDSTAIEFNYDWEKAMAGSEEYSWTVEESAAGDRQVAGKRKLDAVGEEDANGVGYAFRFATFAASDLQKRSRVFRQRLIDATAGEHDEYLAEHSLTWEQRTEQHWHPDFDLNSILKRPVKKLEIPTKTSKGAEVQQQQQQQQQQSGENALKPASKIAGLLERIRQKERLRKDDPLLSLTPEQIKKKSMLGRMPGIIESLTFLYTSTGKSVMPLADLSRRISESYRTPLSEADASDHVLYLAEVVPRWCQISSIGGKRFVKIDKAAKEEDVLAALRGVKV